MAKFAEFGMCSILYFDFDSSLIGNLDFYIDFEHLLISFVYLCGPTEAQIHGTLPNTIKFLANLSKSMFIHIEADNRCSASEPAT